MVDKYFADTYLNGTVPELGASKPVIIEAENGKEYFLKTDIVNGMKQDAVFFQELLSSLLANELGVPIPPFAIIEIEKDFIENNPTLRFSKKFKEGLYFATETLPNIENNLIENYQKMIQQGKPKVIKTWNNFFKNINNSSAITDIIAFDLLVLNFDRFHNEGNILVTRDENGYRNLYAIDHGHCFYTPYYQEVLLDKKVVLEKNSIPFSNPNEKYAYADYCLNMMLNKRVSLGPIFDGLQQNIDFTDSNEFEEIVFKIESITEEKLADLIATIPDEWVSGGVMQKSLYFNFLNRQKYLVRHLIDYLALSDVFSNHRGGVLEWRTEDYLHGIQ
ncbi:HipA family kinase [Carnobacterium maltaromaticum]|uniref:HipA family kinase n=1 Tax=Carnobacterium maltaromaticum TaxID=2751 RepID=UPI000704ACEC|nr:HipA family kinase [Carnobacterium maltaromaticum]KRN70709.1 hypothetical protein IV76_GL001630 [Carnobacterium maltaromaticum]